MRSSFVRAPWMQSALMKKGRPGTILLALAAPDALVMHPGPMNRGVEISSEIADGAQSLIREQVEMGVAVRMAVLEALATHLPNG